MSIAITQENPRLYKHYDNQKISDDGIRARMKERLDATNKYNKIKRGVIKLKKFSVIDK